MNDIVYFNVTNQNDLFTEWTAYVRHNLLFRPAALNGWENRLLENKIYDLIKRIEEIAPSSNTKISKLDHRDEYELYDYNGAIGRVLTVKIFKKSENDTFLFYNSSGAFYMKKEEYERT